MKKKVCFLQGDISLSGGTERIASQIANNLKENYEIHILSLTKKNKENFFDIDKNIIQKVIYNTPKINCKEKAISIIFNIRKYILKHNIDIVISVDTILDIFSVPATRFTKTKVISWEHFNFYENLGSKLRDVGRRLAARYSNAIVTITQEDKVYFEQNLKLKCPVYTIYNPFTLSKVNDQYKSDSKIIISAGRLTHQKGFDILIDVAKDVFEKHRNWKWIILGEGEDRPLIEEKINQYRLKDNVILKGNVNNIEEYYKQAAMFVLTSRYEGFGLVLTEAKAYHLPCISFRCKAGPSEIILDNKNGYLIDCFNTKEMANKICRLIDNKDLRVEFSDKSLDDTEKFDNNAIIEQWIELIEKI